MSNPGQAPGDVSNTSSPNDSMIMALTEARKESVFRRVLRDPRLIFCSIILTLFVCIGIAAPWISPYDPQLMHAGKSLSGPSSEHWLGTDQLSRDVLSRLIYGTRISLQISVYSVTLAVILGVSIGVVSSYFGGWIGSILMRFIDILLAFPALVLAIVVAAYLGASMVNIALVIAVVYMPVIARLTYVVSLAIKRAEFVEAALVVGSSHLRVILRAVLPNAIAPLIVQIALSLGAAIMTESGLSFLGVGVPPPAPSWGSQIASSRLILNLDPLQVVWPALVIFLAILSFNLLGDAIRDFLDPRVGR